MRRVVCAAIRSELGNIICSPRHWDRVCRCQVILSSDDWHQAEQGFVDQFGEFMTRQEAWVVATEANQIVKHVGSDDKNGGTLFSENLY